MNFEKQSAAIGLTLIFLFISFSDAEDAGITAPVLAPSSAIPNAAVPPSPSVVPTTSSGPAAGSVTIPGEAIQTETKTPDGSIITVTKYTGQLPTEIFRSHPVQGYWPPMGFPFYGSPFYTGRPY